MHFYGRYENFITKTNDKIEKHRPLVDNKNTVWKAKEPKNYACPNRVDNGNSIESPEVVWAVMNKVNDETSH